MSAVLVGLALLAVLVLVALAYLLGRAIWNWAEPADQNPGGRESPPPQIDPKIWTGTPFVEYLRLYRRLRKRLPADHE